MGLACGCDCCVLRASEVERRTTECRRRVADIRLRAMASAKGTAVWGLAREGPGGACGARRRAVTVFATRATHINHQRGHVSAPNRGQRSLVQTFPRPNHPQPTLSHINPMPMSLLRKLCFLAMVATSAASATEIAHDWPSKVVKIEELRALTPFELKAPALVAKGEVRGPSLLRVHVAANGSVDRIHLLASCGNADLDEASIHAMREMKFIPFIVDTTPTAVTLLVPVHVPRRLGRK